MINNQTYNDVNESWIENIFNINANIPLQLKIPKTTVNIIMVRNTSLTSRILISDSALISSNRYDTSAEIDGWGVFIRPMGIDACYLLSPVNQTIIVRFISTSKPFDFIGLAARTPSSEVLVNRIHDEHIQKPISANSILILNLALANTEYSFTLPAGTKMYMIKERTNSIPFRFSYVAGRVAAPIEPYQTINAGMTKSVEGIQRTTTLEIFLASSTAGTIIELEFWI